jgi:hypothetical protein
MSPFTTRMWSFNTMRGRKAKTLAADNCTRRGACWRRACVTCIFMCMHSLHGQLACTDGCLAPFVKEVERLVGVESPSASL